MIDRSDACLSPLQELKFEALLQLKALKLRHKQQQLRQQVLVEKWLQEDTHPHMLMDWGRLQRGDLDPVAVTQQQLPLARPQLQLPHQQQQQQQQWQLPLARDQLQQQQEQQQQLLSGAEKLREQQVQQQVAQGRGKAVFRVAAMRGLPEGVITEEERVASAQR